MITRNDLCWCKSGKKWKKCCWPNTNKDLNNDKLRERYKKQYQILIKTQDQIDGIRKSCKLAASMLKKSCSMAKEGVTTNEINDFVVSLHKEANAIPAPLGYGDPPFPKAICTSLNDVICHGIPDNIKLKNGDIVNIDITCILNGYYGDCSAMVAIGEISPDKQLVINTSYQCLMNAIDILKPGIMISDIGDIIESYAEKQGCSVVTQFVGHGVGIQFHEAPQVPHHYNNINIPIVEGMTFTIEPMINAGVSEGYIDTKNNWTARTLDGKPSAQWEHTLLITPNGHEILTTA